jgi:hypothetical protein
MRYAIELRHADLVKDDGYRAYYTDINWGSGVIPCYDIVSGKAAEDMPLACFKTRADCYLALSYMDEDKLGQYEIKIIKSDEM